LRESAREDLVVIGKSGDQRPELASLRRLGIIDPRQETLGRRPVWFGEQHVEADYAGAQINQSASEFSDPRARPWPLTVKRQRSLVDVDDSDRRVVVIPRSITLVCVERPFPNRDDEGRVKDADFGDGQRRHYG
jgi:hypothetical protein